jgi:hypothetical protein
MTNPSLPYAEHHQEPPEVGVQLRIEVDRAARAPINAFSAPRDDTARASCGNGAKANSYHSMYLIKTSSGRKLL